MPDLHRSFEFTKQLVTTISGIIEGFVGGFTAAPQGFHLFVYDVSDLHEITKPNATGIRRWLVQTKLFDRCICAGVVIIKTLRL